ncbi:MAG: PIN domain-containing protein [Pseudomonadota bacterium]
MSDTALLDACVLYPSVAREMLLATAGQGLFTPVWSARIEEEWRRAAARQGPVEGAQAEGEIALARANWPKACRPDPTEDPSLWLPDPGDIHVLASALETGAEVIVTFNLRDFPRRELAPRGLRAIHPDAFLSAFWPTHPERLLAAADRVLARARAGGDPGWTHRALFKKARLPRLGKTLARAG